MKVSSTTFDAEKTLQELSAAAKSGKFKQAGTLIDRAKALQETLIKQIYQPETAEREELVDLVRRIETEINAHKGFLDLLKGQAPKKPLDSIVSRLIFAVKKFFTLNPSQKKLAESILKAEKALLGKQGLEEARVELMALRSQVSHQGSVYRLSTLALIRLNAHLNAQIIDPYPLDQPVLLAEQLLKEPSSQVNKAILNELSVPDHCYAEDLTPKEVVDKIAILLTIRVLRAPDMTAFDINDVDDFEKFGDNMAVKERLNRLVSSLKKDEGKWNATLAELKKYPAVKEAFDDYFRFTNL